MTEPKRFMIGIAGAHGAAPVFAIDAACTGPVAKRFYWSISEVDHAYVCRIDRGIAQLYVCAVVQCLMHTERSYTELLNACNLCVYMFSADQEIFTNNLVSDFEPFMRAYQASTCRPPLAAVINESRPLSPHERLNPERVRAVMPEGAPIMNTMFRYPAEPEGSVHFLTFVDALFHAFTPVPGSS